MSLEFKHYLEFVLHAAEMPGIYTINCVEDYYLVDIGFRLGMNYQGEELHVFVTGFRAHVNNRFESTQDFSWEKLIRLYSGSDKHSLDILKEVLNEYIDRQNFKHSILEKK